MGPEAKERRKTRIVLPEMQQRMVRQTTAFPLIALTMLAVAVAILCKEVLDEVATSETVLPHLALLMISVVCMVALLAGATLFVAFRISHRIAGPTYRILESLKRIQAGDLDFEVRLRKGDFLTEVADQLNETIAAMREPSAAEAEPARKFPDLDDIPAPFCQPQPAVTDSVDPGDAVRR